MSIAKLGSFVVVGLIAAAALLEVFHVNGSAPTAVDGVPARASFQVVDGDTLRTAEGERIRLIGIDAPELPPRARCAGEAELALAAKDRLTDLVEGATHIATTPRPDEPDRDRYDRLLRDVSVDGVDVGEILVSEGLAKVWRGRKGVWC
ncbi:MAG: thermonuclease family protein [Alphaproteobacteria bacterium]|nr:thermonuclease family protein [Alphaproteobacteria bacterium]